MQLLQDVHANHSLALLHMPSSAAEMMTGPMACRSCADLAADEVPLFPSSLTHVAFHALQLLREILGFFRMRGDISSRSLRLDAALVHIHSSAASLRLAHAR